MKRVNESGSINVLLIPFILIILLFIGAVGFGFWAFSSRQDYKNNVAQKITAANTTAVAAEDSKKNAQFAEDYKQPLKPYDGPSAFGSIHLSYPKTWSGYVDTTPNGTADIDGYFYPGVVPDTQAATSSFALRIQIVDQSYSNLLQSFNPLVSSKKVTATPYHLPKLPNVIGTRLDGEIIQNKQGSMIVLPLRDKTIKIWTEASQFEADFDNTILPNFTFSP